MAKNDHLIALTERYRELGIDAQIDYEKFYLYSIVTHSTAIEGSTVTEIENQLLFDEGITAKGRTLVEQMMNLDLKQAYEESIRLARQHAPITVDVLKSLSRLVMQHTGTTYKTALGEFSSANGDLRLVNVSAGVGGKSYLSYQKVPTRLKEFCDWINEMRSRALSAAERYELSFEAHYRLVTIHPWVDGNGRMARLIMNHIQFEYGLILAKILKEDKASYINALIATREQEDLSIFKDFMAGEMAKTLSDDIAAFLASTEAFVKEKTSQRGKGTKRREMILDLLREHPEFSASKLAAAVGITAKGVERHLAHLKAAGIIRREGPAKGGKWVVVSE